MVAEGKETREFDGRQYVLERGLRGDFAFIKRGKATAGQLIYRKTARNFNPMMATALITLSPKSKNRRARPARLQSSAYARIFVDAIFQGPSTKSASSAARCASHESSLLHDFVLRVNQLGRSSSLD